MKKSNILSLLFLLGFTIFLTAQQFSTITYYKNDTLKLELDLFTANNANTEKLPLVIFMHGGGFAGGDKKTGYPFCEYISKRGYMAATLAYTLYMKDKSFSCDGITAEKIKAIQHGTNDLWLATAYFIENSDKYSIDTTKIFIAGSSAGAESCLHSAFWDYETMNIYDKKLHEGFKYAGLIAGAGAIMDLNLINAENMIPVMMFHGDKDKLVPYATAAHHFCKTNTTGWLMFFGSYSIYNYLVALNGTTCLVAYSGRGHEYRAELFNNDQQKIVDFLDQVIAGKKFQTQVIVPFQDEKITNN